MIWSCEIDYHGWEDDIHHHHFFIESDAKPTKEEVVQHYNWHHFNAKDYGHNWLRKAYPGEKWRSDTGIVALDERGRIDYTDVYISISPLKVEKLDGSN